MSTKPVFISYSHTNLAIVNHLKHDLQVSNIPIWLDHESLTPGTSNWGIAIRQGVQSCQALIYIASPAAQASNYVISEIDLAFYYQIPIYPFWIEGNHWLEAAPLGMSRTQYIDARTDYTAAFKQLLKYLSSSTNPQPVDPQQIIHQQPKQLSSSTLFHILTGHTRPVNSVAWSPENSRLATGSYDNTARIWDAQTGQSLLILTCYNTDNKIAWSPNVAWSPDSNHIATSGGDNIARIWNAQTGRSLLTLTGHTNEISSITWSPDSNYIATASSDKTARIWNAQTSQSLLTITGHTDAIWCIAWSPDGSRLATGSYDNTARIWNAQTGQPLLTLTEYTRSVSNLAWSPDSAYIAIVSRDRDTNTQIRNSHTGKLLLNLTDYLAKRVVWSPDGTYIATIEDSLNNAVHLWNAQTGQPLLTLTGHTFAVNGIAWSPDGSRIATASADNTVRIWGLA